MNGHYNIRRIETILGTPVKNVGEWFGGFDTKEAAQKAAKQMAEREAIEGVAIKFEISYMK